MSNRHHSVASITCILYIEKQSESDLESEVSKISKGIMQPCTKFTGGHRYRSVISITLQCNVIAVTILHEFFFVNLRLNCRICTFKNTYGGNRLLLYILHLLNAVL